ncbi:MAG: DUF1499 domain-containing protein [Pseudomonadota bacterium]
MSKIAWIGVSAFAIFLVAGAWVRFAPSHPETWHVDPDTVQKTAKPNQYLVSDSSDADEPPVVLPVSSDTLWEKITEITSADSSIQRLSSSADRNLVTYIVRTPLMKYPDFLSLKVIERDGQAVLSIYSRSRFGYRDFGKNAERVRAFIDMLSN